LEDADLESTGKIVPIGDAHGPGLLHRGLWLAVLRKGMDDSKHEIYLLKRAPSLKTCPGVWGPVGEHSNSGESWEETARRAMREELTLQDGKHKLVNLLPNQSILVRTPYAELRRRELQATGLFAVSLSRDEANEIQPDEEVADVKWVPIQELETMHMCNKEIADLAKLMAQCLKQQGFD
jgi:isopentenyldiphosphate isomerase